MMRVNRKGFGCGESLAGESIASGCSETRSLGCGIRGNITVIGQGGALDTLSQVLWFSWT